MRVGGCLTMEGRKRHGRVVDQALEALGVRRERESKPKSGPMSSSRCTKSHH